MVLGKSSLLSFSIFYSISSHLFEKFCQYPFAHQVRQDRNVHDYLADLDSEVPLYMKVKKTFIISTIRCSVPHPTLGKNSQNFAFLPNFPKTKQPNPEIESRPWYCTGCSAGQISVKLVSQNFPKTKTFPKLSQNQTTEP